MRIRDPIHGLIVFSEDVKIDMLAWKLINTKEFQRLRRIKQLGFSELVYPGATHTRFSHSIGVFHMTRALIKVLKHNIHEDDFDQNRADVTACAALLHDLGHGPFSHAFEGANKSIGRFQKHDSWTAEIVRGDTEVGDELEKQGKEFRESVANLMDEDFPQDIYSSIVHSQFDADRLDYLRRDRYMTGTQHGGFDWEWLLNNLEVGEAYVGPKDDPVSTDTFVLGPKGLQAAEEYLLGRFHLYTQLYMHKTTRGAEKLLGCLLLKVANCLSSQQSQSTGLPDLHPLALYYQEGGGNLVNYLALDDSVVWGGLHHLKHAKDEVIAELAGRLLNRDLYKCFDIGEEAKKYGSDKQARFNKALNEARQNNEISEIDVLSDRFPVSPYKNHDYESPSALEKILLRPKWKKKGHDDIAEFSSVIKAISEENYFRLYCRDENVLDKVKRIWKEVVDDG